MIEDRGLGIFATVVVLVILVVITTCLRIYVRLRIVKIFGLDDALMLLATAFYVFMATTTFISVAHGNGKRFSELSQSDTVLALLHWWLAQAAYALTCIVAKLSICLFLLRISVKKVHIWILYGIGAVVSVAGIILFFMGLLQCKPISFFWDKFSQTGTCVPVEVTIKMFYGYSSVNAICDLAIGILPIFIIGGMKANKRTKTAIICILSVACIASAAVLVRIPYIADYALEDFLYATFMISICSHIEAALAIAAGSLPTLRPLFRFSRQETSASPKAQRSYSQIRAFESGRRSGKPTLSGSRRGFGRKDVAEGDAMDGENLAENIPMDCYDRDNSESTGDIPAASVHTTQEALPAESARRYSPV